MSFEKAKRLGLGGEHPSHPSRRKQGADCNRNKFGAIRTEYNGRKYDSKAEAAHASALDLDWLGGLVREWFPQVPFHLGCPENTYVVDFVVIYTDGHKEAHEVKGRRTAKFNHDLRLWNRYGPFPLKIFTKGQLLETIIPGSLQ